MKTWSIKRIKSASGFLNPFHAWCLWSMTIKSCTVHYFSGGYVSNDLSMKVRHNLHDLSMNQISESFTSCKSINLRCISLGHMALPGVKGLNGLCILIIISIDHPESEMGQIGHLTLHFSIKCNRLKNCNNYSSLAYVGTCCQSMRTRTVAGNFLFILSCKRLPNHISFPLSCLCQFAYTS